MLTFLLATALADDPTTSDEAAPATAPSTEDEEATAPDGGEKSFGWGGVPAVNYNTDAGFGYGVIGTGYWYDGVHEPYKRALTLRIFLTTKWVQAHMVRLDALDVFDSPVRLLVEGGYYSTVTANFCGFAGSSSCDPAAAEAAADAAGFTAGEDRDAYVRRYYFQTYTQPYLIVNGRYKLKPLPHKLEVLAGYRGSMYVDGTPSAPGAFEGSYFDTVFPDGQAGFASVLQTGLVVDNRDNEPAPNSGYFSEASVRGSSFAFGSAWDYVGANITLRGYSTLVPERLTTATRLVGDGIWGDEVPVNELVRFGGSVNYEGIGGEYSGRGVPSRRFVGKAKAVAQQELRLRAATFTPGDTTLDIGLVGFADYGWAAADWSDLSLSESSLTTGGGLRVILNKNFIIRADYGLWPAEDWASGMYINLDHIY